MTFAAGTSISYYRIVSRLGAGGMGEVYLAEDTRLGRKVALKILPPQFTKEADRIRRFEQEARSASALNHPNIITIFEVGRSGDTNFIVTEFIEGQTLRQRIATSRLSLRDALKIGIQVASALSAAHAAGIVHRDIKPENIMLRPDGYVKVLDFGLVKLTEPIGISNSVDHESDTKILITDPSVVMGTPHYMSPEQARGFAIDARADIFSLGVVLYEMIAGRTPYDGTTPSDIIASILYKEPPLLARYTREAPDELERITTKSLRKDREERYQTAKDIAIDLRNLRQHLAFEEIRERSFVGNSTDDSLATRGTRETVVDFSRTPEYSSGDVPPFQSSGAQNIRPMSSAEYIITGLRQRKRGLIFTLLAIILVGASITYFAGSNKKAVESIAILPFANESGDPKSDYVADGMTESLIKNLSQLPKLKVMSLISVLRYKGNEIDPRAVRRDLNVDAVLSGRITKRGDGIALTIELVDTRDNTRIWGDQYTRKFSDMLALQEEILGAMSQKLELKLDSNERKRMDAYKLYLMGRNYWNKRRPDDLKKGIELFQQAVEKNPQDAKAYAGIADSYTLLAVYGSMTPDEAFPKAKEAAEKALAIDDSLAEAHTSLGFVKTRYEWDWEGAEASFRRAIELNPNYALAHQWYSNYLASVGRYQDAIDEAKRGQELSPLSLIGNAQVGWMYFFARRYDEGAAASLKVIEMDPNFFSARRYYGLILEQKGQFEQAVEQLEKAREHSGGSPVVIAALGHAYALAGKRQEAEKIIEELLDPSKPRRGSGYDVAVVYVGLGEKEKAFEWLDKAYEQRDDFLAYLKADPRFDPLRTDTRFDNLLRRLGLY
jgi:serine/threonine protein kinase/tetratricopeptide (TPR) repeat protein